MRVLSETDIRQVITVPDSIEAVKGSFAALARGDAQLPAVMHFDFPSARGDAHAKGAYIQGSSVYVVKVASGFYSNAERGLPVTAGLMIAFDSTSGEPVSLLCDNGFLTHLRTGAAGAVAASCLSDESHTRLGLIGAGAQARFQTAALSTIRTFNSILVWDRSHERAERFAREMRELYDLDVSVAVSASKVVRQSNVLVTVTPSHEPIVSADWVEPGTLVIAVGADMPEKQELDSALIKAADKVFADRVGQCVEAGEIHHAVKDGFAVEDITGELGDVLVGKISGIGDPDDVVVCDLTGVGTHDAAVAEFVILGAERAGLGSELLTPPGAIEALSED